SHWRLPSLCFSLVPTSACPLDGGKVRVSRAFFFFQAEDGIRDRNVTGVQTCALPIYGIELTVAVTSRRLYIFLSAGVRFPDWPTTATLFVFTRFINSSLVIST